MATRILSHMQKSFSSFFEYLLDTIAPPDPRIREIERMKPSEFAEKASKNSTECAIDNVLSLFSYKDPLVKAALLEIKSYGNRKMAAMIGRTAYELLVDELSELKTFANFTSPILVPIPLTKKSLRTRGWNQCELIADEISRADYAQVIEVRKDILIKAKETEDQVGKTRTERFANLKGCFACRNSELVRGKNVIILDDIVTTGATLSEARRTIAKAGARKVICVAIAH